MQLTGVVSNVQLELPQWLRYCVWHGDFLQRSRQIQESDRNDLRVVWTLVCLDCFRYRLDVDRPLTQAV